MNENVTFSKELIKHMTMGNIPGKLKYLRKSNNYTQEQLADMLGVSYATVQKLEKGETALSFARARMYSDIFGISLEELAGRNTDHVQIMHDTKAEYKLREKRAVDLYLHLDQARVGDEEAQAFVEKLLKAIRHYKDDIEDAEEL